MAGAISRATLRLRKAVAAGHQPHEARDWLAASGFLDRFTDRHGPNVLVDPL